MSCVQLPASLGRAVWLTRFRACPCSKRPLLQGDKFSIGSDKVGSQPLDNDVYRANCASCVGSQSCVAADVSDLSPACFAVTESRERMANAKAVNYKGAGDVANRA